MVDPNFLDVRFSDITLIHILVVLGIPYLVLYLFEKFTKFEKFTDKWKAGLFVFSIGGLIVLASVYLHDAIGTSFTVNYFVCIMVFVMILLMIKKKFYANVENEKRTGWIKIRLRNGELYTGVFDSKDKFGIQISAGREHGITREVTGREAEVKAKKIKFSWNEILSILYY
jgi:hypothetical protein